MFSKHNLAVGRSRVPILLVVEISGFWTTYKFCENLGLIIDEMLTCYGEKMRDLPIVIADFGAKSGIWLN